MNCEHHNPNCFSYNDLICTAYSPEGKREQPVNNANQPVKSMCLLFSMANYSQLISTKFGGGEQVLFQEHEKNSLDKKISGSSEHLSALFEMRRFTSAATNKKAARKSGLLILKRGQAAGLDAAGFLALARAVLRLM